MKNIDTNGCVELYWLRAGVVIVWQLWQRMAAGRLVEGSEG